MTGVQDDVRLPFSVLDPIVGDMFSVLWEPEMIRETGSALKILTGKVLSQIGLTVLQATVMATLMSALQWPISQFINTICWFCYLTNSRSFDEVGIPH
jgi:hypothetical protein